MIEESRKQIMYLNYEGFTQIIWNLQSEIVWLRTRDFVIEAYERMKQLYIHVHAHLDENKIKNFKDKEWFLKEFKEIEKIIYNPLNKKISTLGKYKKEANKKIANDMMDILYMELKRHMKESGLEAFYGTPSQEILEAKWGKNIKNILGKDINEE